MKILTCTTPGQFDYSEAQRPELKPGQTIIRIRRVGICGTDIHAFDGTQPYFSYPRILGHELGAEFVEGDAPGFTPGEAVTIIPYFNCGTCIACRQGKTNCCVNMQVAGVHADGGMREYFSVPSSSLLHGNGLSLDELALVEPLSVSAHGVRRAAIQPGEFVLVIGAGPIGIGAMQFAKIAGAKVVALDVNERRLDFCRKVIGVDHALQACADVDEQLKQVTNNDMPTAVIDATGNLKAINNAFRYMAHTARYVLIGLQKAEISFSHPEFHKREATLMSSRNATKDDFDYVMKCIRDRRVDPLAHITHRLAFGDVKDHFKETVSAGDVMKAMIGID